MRVITAVELFENKVEDKNIIAFLAGGISKCPEWQNEVIKELQSIKSNTNKLVLFNPRRENFPINNPNATVEQIEWEFKWLDQMDIFSMYFSDGDSDQPICMYELGRNILRMQNKFPLDWDERIIISCAKGYKRINDVIIQTALATNNTIEVHVFDDYTEMNKSHARRIIDSYMYIYSVNKYQNKTDPCGLKYYPNYQYKYNQDVAATENLFYKKGSENKYNYTDSELRFKG